MVILYQGHFTAYSISKLAMDKGMAFIQLVVTVIQVEEAGLHFVLHLYVVRYWAYSTLSDPIFRGAQ